MYFQDTSIAASGADDIGLDPGIYPHRCHAGTNFPIPGHLADLYPSRMALLGKRCDLFVASLAGKALPDFIGETATFPLLSIPVHTFLPLT